MLGSKNTILAFAVGLLAIRPCVGRPAEPTVSASPSPTPTLPGHCSTTVDDFVHSTAWVKTHECFTYTSASPSPSCPKYTKDPMQICPLYIKVSTISVPCATDCCPSTPTATVDSPCTTSEKCPIPTEWITVTTGSCAGESTEATRPTQRPYGQG